MTEIRFERTAQRSVSFGGLARRRSKPIQVIGFAARIEPVLDAEQAGIALPLLGRNHALHLVGLAVGKVDVEHDAFGPAGVKQLA